MLRCAACVLRGCADLVALCRCAAAGAGSHPFPLCLWVASQRRAVSDGSRHGPRELHASRRRCGAGRWRFARLPAGERTLPRPRPSLSRSCCCLLPSVRAAGSICAWSASPAAVASLRCCLLFWRCPPSRSPLTFACAHAPRCVRAQAHSLLRLDLTLLPDPDPPVPTSSTGGSSYGSSSSGGGGGGGATDSSSTGGGGGVLPAGSSSTAGGGPGPEPGQESSTGHRSGAVATAATSPLISLVAALVASLALLSFRYFV